MTDTQSTQDTKTDEAPDFAATGLKDDEIDVVLGAAPDAVRALS